MAPQLKPAVTAEGQRLRAQALAEFIHAAPCQWCGESPTAQLELSPPEVKNGVLVADRKYAYGCWTCAVRLNRVPGISYNATDLAKVRAADARYDSNQRRKAGQLAQHSLFDADAGPGSGIVKG